MNNKVGWFTVHQIWSKGKSMGNIGSGTVYAAELKSMTSLHTGIISVFLYFVPFFIRIGPLDSKNLFLRWSQQNVKLILVLFNLFWVHFIVQICWYFSNQPKFKFFHPTPAPVCLISGNKTVLPYIYMYRYQMDEIETTKKRLL